MGDMKTPDFDDLLAAFDIPDIHAIQSSPEPKQDEASVDVTEAAPPSFACSPAPPSEPPVVSVIVKNTVRPESCEEEEEEEDEDDSGLDRRVGGAAGPHIANGCAGPAGPAQQPAGVALWPRHPPLQSVLSNREGASHTGAEVISGQNLAGDMSSLQPESSSIPARDSPPPPPPPPPPPLHSLQKKETFSRSPPPAPSGRVDADSGKVVGSDEDDSDPDLGGPLVIHESPEFIMPLPPKFKYRMRAQSELSEPPPLSSRGTRHLENDPEDRASVPGPSAPQPQTPQEPKTSETRSCVSAPHEKYPEHVIEERDSPESPPPSETGLFPPTRTSSPPPAPPPSAGVFERREEPGDQTAGGGLSVSEENTGPSSEDAAGGGKTPLKVKIKMPTGGVTRAVTGGEPKRGVRATSRGGDGPRASTEGQKTRSRKEGSQDAAALDGPPRPSTAVKARVSPTAVSITRTTALPSVVSLKTLNNGTSPAGGRPASIVSSTGAIISKSQSSLVDTFNKILNNKNLLPSYKPDLSPPPPPEWGLPLPAQVSCSQGSDEFMLEMSNELPHD